MPYVAHGNLIMSYMWAIMSEGVKIVYVILLHNKLMLRTRVVSISIIKGNMLMLTARVIVVADGIELGYVAMANYVVKVLKEPY